MQTVGVIRQLARYPVKSMQGEALASLPLTLQGFEEDRRYAFVRSDARSSFPWLTGRELPELLRYQTAVDKAGTPDVTVNVTTASGERWPVDSNELRQAIESRYGKALFLLRDYRGCYDVSAVSLISRQTIARIAEETSTRQDPWRFRPNLLVELANGEAFDELKWVGKTIRIGDKARIAVIKVDERCVMITLDPATGKSTPDILKNVAQKHSNCAGVYATVLTAGEVRAGDAISLES